MTRRRSIVAFVLSALVVSSMPVLAADAGLEIASEHTDFGTGTESAPTTLQNASVTGSGDTAYIKALEVIGSTTSRPADGSSTSDTARRGLRINPNTNLAGVEIDISSQTSGATTAYLTQTDGTILDSSPISSGKATLEATLTSGTNYYVTVDAGGNSYTVGRYLSASYPYTATDLDITAGVFGGTSTTQSGAYAIKSVTAIETFGQSATYVSATHSASNLAKGFTDLTLDNASATVTWTADTDGDGTFETTANQTTYTTSGNHTQLLGSVDADRWRVNVSWSKTGSSPTAELADEGLLFQASDPQASNFQPSDGTKLSSSSTTFSVQVNDSDFPLAQSDQVEATLHIDGTQEYQTTITSNQTVSTTETISEGGDHTYHWVLTDSYGESTTTATKTITVPAQVQIRTVSENHSLIESPTTVEITIAGSNETVDKRTVSDGNVSLSGLDITQSYVLVASADGYYQRAIYLPSIYEQSTMFLLNKSKPAVANEFILVDNTGQYNDRPKLIIEKIINRSLYDPSATAGYQWTIVAGDRLGADGRMLITLRDNARYRIKVKNVKGDIRSLGEYSAKQNESVTLTIGTIQWHSPRGETFQLDAWMANVSGTRYVKFAYSDPADNTSELSLRIHEQGNVSNELFSATETGLGNYTETVPVPANSSVTWVANYTVTQSGTTYSNAIPVGQPGSLPLPIEEKWLTPMIYLFLVGVLSATPKASARTGALLIASLGILIWWFGWAPLSGPAVGVAGAIALIGKAGDYAEAM